MATRIRDAFRVPIVRVGAVCLLSMAAFFVARSFRLQPAYSDGSVYKVDLAGRPALGSPAAKVTIVLFGDYSCPHSRSLYRTVKQVMSPGGPVRLVWAFGPLQNQEARSLARMAMAAGELGKFWELHDWVMTDYQRAAGADGLARAAEQLKIEPATLQAALQSPGAQRRFEHEVAAAAALGLEHVPTMFVNGRRVRGAAPRDKLQEIVDHQLASADRMLEGETTSVNLYERLTAGGARRVPTVAEASLSARGKEQP
jgi:protein-disulfide isomerase